MRSATNAYRLLPLGDHALVVELGERMNDASFERVQSLVQRFEQWRPPEFLELVPAFTSVTFYYDPLRNTWEEVCQAVDALMHDLSSESRPPLRRVEVPVCYGGAYGPDLEFVAQHNQLSTQEVIELHSAAEYRVQMIGFSPGFPYLAGMSPRLATPRLASPRLITPAGSVGIAGEQTGIYSLETPGGWRIIGRTPLALFRPNDDPPTLLQAGDLVRFVPLPAAEFPP